MFGPELPPDRPTWVHTQERDIERLEEENRLMRKWMWLNHGHTGLYGDDGEMQCGMCYKQFGFWDWKRTPINEILNRIIKAQPWYVVKGKEAQDEP